MRQSLGLIVMALLLSPPLMARQFELLIGPPSLGQGGSNPVSIPPANPIDWQLTYINEEQREWVVSVIPGLLYGQRWQKGSLYAALGGGILITSTGLGLGVHHAFGYESKVFWRSFRFITEYRQIMGISAYTLQFPYTFRLGMRYEF